MPNHTHFSVRELAVRGMAYQDSVVIENEQSMGNIRRAATQYQVPLPEVYCLAMLLYSSPQLLERQGIQDHEWVWGWNLINAVAKPPKLFYSSPCLHIGIVPCPDSPHASGLISCVTLSAVLEIRIWASRTIDTDVACCTKRLGSSLDYIDEYFTACANRLYSVAWTISSNALSGSRASASTYLWWQCEGSGEAWTWQLRQQCLKPFWLVWPSICTRLANI